LSVRLRLKILDILNAQKGIFGTGLNTMEICRRLNGVRRISFCSEQRTIKGYNRNFQEGNFCTKNPHLTCKIKYPEVRKNLLILERKGYIKSKKATMIDLKRIRGLPVISKDKFRIWFIR